MTSGNSRIDAVADKYLREGAPSSSPILRGSYPSMPGNSAPHIMDVAYDYFNATIYKNKKNDAALRINVTWAPGPGDDRWCYSKNRATGELIAFLSFAGGTTYDFENLVQAMAFVSNRWRAKPMPDAQTIESWRREI